MTERQPPTDSAGKLPAPRIVIVRTSAMGDVVHALPLAMALRRRWPDARIGWVVESRFAPLLDGHPAIDELFEVRLRDWRRRPFSRTTLTEVLAFLRKLDRFDASIAIDAMGNHKGGLIAALSRAGRVVGAVREARREPSSAVWIDEPIAVTGRHVIEAQRSLGAAVGAVGDEIELGGEGIRSPSAPTGSPSLLIHPGAGWRNKEYPTDRWATVACELAPDYGPLGILEAPGEEGLVEAITGAAAGAATAVRAGDLPTLTALLRASRLLLAGDTGPLHLAVSLGTPAVCVLGPTDPDRNGAWGRQAINLYRRLPCSFCYQRLDEAKACLLEIGPLEVAAAARRLLGS